MLKKNNSHYLSFTRKEKNGIVAILSAIIILVLVPFFYPFIFSEKKPGANNYNKEIDSLKILKSDSSVHYYKKNYDNENYGKYDQSSGKDFYNTTRGELFYFDPNSLSVQDWIRLGVKEKTANTIQNYLSKGGRFRAAGDIKKIWGLRPDLVKRILPYVKIKQVNNNETYYGNKNYPSYEKKPYEKKVFQPIDINQADSLAYVDLPGIGPSYARRIINFRNKLGGFYSVNQVGETFGLPDSTFQKLKPLLLISGAAVKKININTATLDEMKAHPYFRYQFANTIIQYRNQHGPYKTIDDIKKIMIVNDELFNKIAPYLVVE